MIFRFGDHEIDTELYEVRRDGRQVPVEPQVFDVLAYLVTHRDRLISKEELLDEIWGDRFVSESALTSRLKSARRAVGDDGTAQRVIRTVHGRGYRFIAPLDDAAPPAVPAEAAPPAVPAEAAPPAVPAEAAPPAVPAEAAAPAAFSSASAPPSSAAPATPETRERSVAVLAPPETALTSPGAGRAARTPSAWPLLGRADELTALADHFHDGLCGGVLLTGGAGVGKTRLADEVVRLVEQSGVPVARAVGHPEARSLPLAALTHLLPGNVAEAGPDGELDRAAVFHRARAALGERGRGRQLLCVDDVDQLDDLSLAVLASLVVARDVFGVFTMRTPADMPAGVRTLVKDGHLERLDVPPLDPLVSETLLHRVLGGPVESATAGVLVEVAQGNAGVLRQLVDSSLDAGSLSAERGVWALTGPLVATSDLRQLVRDRLVGLGEAARQGMELLAVAGALGLDVLTGLVGEEAVDDLDERGLLDVRTSGRRTDVALIHPLFGEILRAELPALRARRLRRSVADAVEGTGGRRREDRIRVTAWRLDAGGTVDPSALVDAVRLALADGDHRLCRRLLDRLEGVAEPAVAAQLRAEWHFRQGENRRVEELLAPLTAADLPATAWAQVVRRRAANRFYGMGDFPGSVALIEDALPTVHGSPRLALEALRATLLALGGNVTRAIGLSAGVVGEAEGPIRLEALRARSLALAVHGEGTAALALVDEGLALGASMAPDLDLPGLSVLRFAGIVGLTEMGRLDEARRAVLEARRHTAGADGGWSALGAARVALLAGEGAEVRRVLERPLLHVRALGHEATERWLLALVAHSRIYEGDVATAAEEIRRVVALEDGPRGLFHNEIDRAKAWLALHEHGVDVACELLVASAEDAGRYGKRTFEATLLHDVVRLDQPARALPRLTALAAVVEGPLVEIRAAHAGALAAADGTGLERVARGFEDLGCTLLAAEAWAHAAGCWSGAGERAAGDAARFRARDLAARSGTPLRTPPLTGYQ